MTDHSEHTQPTPIKNANSSKESSPSLMGRRQVLTTGVATAAMLFALPKVAKAQPVPEGGLKNVGGGADAVTCAAPPTDCASPTLTAPSDGTFPFPHTLYSEHAASSTDTFRTLSSDLEVVENELLNGAYSRRFQIQGTTTKLLPGPTFCVYPGDRLALNVANNLPADSGDTYCPKTETNRPHCFNHMNMHFHGLHVSPLSLTPNGIPVSGTDPRAQLPGAKSSDDVLFTLEPGRNHDYCVQLPDFHGPGTHWYHAHVHGTTALDVANGIVGALIVQEPPGEEILAGAPDVVMVIQEELPPLQCGDILRAGPGGIPSPQCRQTPPPFSNQQLSDRAVYNQQSGGNVSNFNEAGSFLVNGQKVDGGGTPPTLTLKKGEVQRWRMINATGTPRGFMQLQLVRVRTRKRKDGSTKTITTKRSMYRVATDGVTLYGKEMKGPQVRVKSYDFSPGNRVDFLINLPPGEYELQKKSFGARASQEGVLVKITVTDEEYTTDPTLKTRFRALKQGVIPGTAPCYLQPLPDSATLNPKTVVFQASGPDFPTNQVTTVGRGDFQISDIKYDETGSKMTVALGDTEDWILANVPMIAIAGNGSQRTKQATHPFHIHVNPFQIVELGTVTSYDQNQAISATNPQIQWDTQIDAADRVWWDTIAVQPGTAIKIRHRFWDYYGTYVLHCHVLIHEDQGMMWDVEVTDTNDKGIPPCQTLADCITDYT